MDAWDRCKFAYVPPTNLVLQREIDSLIWGEISINIGPRRTGHQGVPSRMATLNHCTGAVPSIRYDTIPCHR